MVYKTSSIKHDQSTKVADSAYLDKSNLLLYPMPTDAIL